MTPNKFLKMRLLRVDQAAERLNCTRRHIYHLIDTGQLPALSIGRKKGYRIPEDALEAFILRRLREFLAEVGLCEYCELST